MKAGGPHLDGAATSADGGGFNGCCDLAEPGALWHVADANQTDTTGAERRAHATAGGTARRGPPCCCAGGPAYSRRSNFAGNFR